MPIRDVIITKEAESHITKHSVRRKEVLEVLNNFKFIQRKKSRFLIYGKTNTGRFLTIILERKEDGIFYLVTTRDSVKSEKSLYKKKVK